MLVIFASAWLSLVSLFPSLVSLSNANWQHAGSSTGEETHTRHKGQRQASAQKDRVPAKGSRKGTATGIDKRRLPTAKRRRAGSQPVTQGEKTSEVDTDVGLKVLGGGQPLVDDFNDDDFEARKVEQYNCRAGRVEE